MINLLPQQYQRGIRAAYSNTLLLRYVILLLAALIFLAATIGGAYLYLDRTAAQADNTKQENEQRATGYAETQASAGKLRTDLATAKELFEGEIHYSKVLTRLSSLFPDGTAIDSLQLSNSSFTEPVTLAVRVRNEAAAKALSSSFSESSYVTNVSLGRVSTSDNSSYPYSAELTFTFDRSIAQ